LYSFVCSSRVGEVVVWFIKWREKVGEFEINGYVECGSVFDGDCKWRGSVCCGKITKE